MRYRFLFVFLLSSLVACTFQAELLTPPPSFPSTPVSLPATTFTSTPVIELPSATPPPFPTPISLATSAPSTNLDIAPITFDVNGTYRDIVDTLSAGSNKTYSVTALKGQVMSVSILQSNNGEWAHIPMRIIGADDSLLCQADCTFWRGVLPSTTTYYITLYPSVTVVNYTLRVAVNPIGTATQSFQFLSPDHKVSFSYTDDFAPVRVSGLPTYKIVPEQVLEYIDTLAYTGTNLFEAYFMMGSSNAASLVESCTQPASLGGPEIISGVVTINGTQFTRSEATGIAAGNIYEQVFHRAAINGVCYEIIFLVHFGNIGAYSPELQVTEFDRAAVLSRLESVLATLVINP